MKRVLLGVVFFWVLIIWSGKPSAAQTQCSPTEIFRAEKVGQTTTSATVQIQGCAGSKSWRLYQDVDNDNAGPLPISALQFATDNSFSVEITILYSSLPNPSGNNVVFQLYNASGQVQSSKSVNIGSIAPNPQQACSPIALSNAAITLSGTDSLGLTANGCAGSSGWKVVIIKPDGNPKEMSINIDPGNYTFTASGTLGSTDFTPASSLKVQLRNLAGNVVQEKTLTTPEIKKPKTKTGDGNTSAAESICNTLDDPAKTTCTNCAKESGVWTSLGCINYVPQKFIENLLRLAIGIAGGVAFLMIIYGGFIMMTSAGNPKQLASAQEIITSAIAGILLIVFSVLILKIIGVDILKLPGLAP